MTEPTRIAQGLEAATAELSRLSRAYDEAHDAYVDAEFAWLRVYDQTAADLKALMSRDGRKGDPAEHWIETEARRRYPDQYERWKRAKRAVQKLEQLMQTRRAELSGWQSQARNEQAALGAAAYVGQRAA